MVRSKRFLLLVVAASIASSWGAALPEKPQRYAFVGSFIKMEPLDCPYSDDDSVVCLDSVYLMTYRVEQVLEGPLVVGQQLQFKSADHYGKPPYSSMKSALLYAYETSNGIWTVKYHWTAAYKTRSGGFASCGCEPAYAPDGVHNEKSPLPKECVAITFAPEVSEDLTHKSAGYVAALRKRAAYKVQKHRAICQRGVPVGDIYRINRNSAFEVLTAVPVAKPSQQP